MPDNPPPTPQPADNAPPPADDSIPIDGLMKNLMETVSDEPEPPKPPKEEAPPTPPKPAEPPPKDPAEKPITFRKPPAPKRPALPTATPQTNNTPPPPAPTPPPAPQDTKKWRSELLDEERQLLEDAEYAEKKFPGKYTGRAEKVEKFIKEHQEMVSRADFDPDSSQYKDLMKRNPAFKSGEMREIITAQATESAANQFRPEVEDMKHQQFVRDEEPKISAELEVHQNQLVNTAFPDELLKAFRDAGGGPKGVKVLEEEFAMEFKVASDVINLVLSDIAEFERLDRVGPNGRAISKPAADESDPKWEQHQRLSKMVKELSDEFRDSGSPAELQRKDPKTGQVKWYVTRDEWNGLPPAERNKFWTFTNKELIERGKKHSKITIANVIQQRKDELARQGFVRAPRPTPPKVPAPPPKAATPATPAPNPAPPPSRSAAPSTPAPTDPSISRLTANLAEG